MALHRRVERERGDLDLAHRSDRSVCLPVRFAQLLVGRLAHSHGPVGDAAHHHALEDCLPSERSIALSAQLAIALEPRGRIGKTV
jgi:hypothetical protein